MSLNYTCNQYQDAFVPIRLRNWLSPKPELDHKPQARTGTTKPLVNEKCHLKRGTLKKQDDCPWGLYVGTWDLPGKLPGPKVDNPTARRQDAYERLMKEKEEADYVIYGRKKALDYAKTVVPPSAGRRRFRSSADIPPKPTDDALLPADENSPKTSDATASSPRSGARNPTKSASREPALTARDELAKTPEHGIPHILPSEPCPCVQVRSGNAEAAAAPTTLLSPGDAYRQQIPPQ